MNPELLSIIINLLSSVIYDGMKIGISYLFSINREKVTEKNIKDAVTKSVSKELANKVSQSRIFDCDAMQNYIKHMQPIQKIYRHVFVIEKNIGNSTEDLIVELQTNTTKYLSEHGKNINVLDEKEIKEFYTSIVKICDEVSASLLNHKDVALARLLYRQGEKSQNVIVSEINGNNEMIRSDLGQILHKINELIPINKSEAITMVDPKQTMLEAMPYKYVGGSEKKQCVKKLTSSLRKYQWIHIYGKMFTGKTQTLIRVAEHLASYVWITLKNNEFQNVCIRELELQEETVVILDGIPNIANPMVRAKCLQILSECKEKRCKLITSGYEDAELYVKGFVDSDELISIELTGLTKTEVDEIMRNHNAPEALFHIKAYHNFVEICKGLPPIVMEIVYRMEANGWKYDDDIFMTILTRRTDSIEEQMKQLFLDAVKDEEARRLYYRIVYASRAVEKNWIQPIAAIPERISQSDKSLELLKNRWLYSDGRLYRCPNTILHNYAEEQLDQEEKRAINEFLVTEITKHTLDPEDITDIFLYYSRLENYDAQGLLCYQIMEQMIENGIKDYPVHPEKFWQGMPLPQKMPSFIKILVRAQQMYYMVWRGDTIKDCDEKRNELWNIAQDDVCKVMVIVFGIKFALIDVKTSLLFFNDFLGKCTGSLNIPEQLKQKFTNIETLDVPEVLMEKSAFSVYNTMIELNISQLIDFEFYIGTMEQFFTEEQWGEVENTEDIDAIISCMLDKILKNSEDNLERYLSAIQKLYYLLNRDKTPMLWKSVLYSYLLAYQKKCDYEGAKNLFFSVDLIIKESPLYYLDIIDIMARIAHDNNDIELEKQLFQWEMKVIMQNKSSDFNRIRIDSCLLYLERLAAGERQEIDNVREVMRYIACNVTPEDECPFIVEKLEIEYWMKIYLIESLETEMSEFLLFVEQLLEDYEKQESVALKSILTKMCHVLGYLSGKLLRNDAPEKFADGSDYASPKLRMFWNDVEDIEVISFWQPHKIEMMYYICAALADKYRLNDIGNRLFMKLILRQNFWSKTLESMYRLESYLQTKFLEQNELSKLAYFMQKTYEPQERMEIEKNGEYYFIVREQMIFSIFILQRYQQSVSSAMELCGYLIELIDEEQYSEMGRKYYKEYKQVLRLVINEDADFDLLKDAFHLIQGKEELKNMDSGVLPLLLLQAPKTYKETLKSNIIKSIDSFHFDNDFVMNQRVKMIESL